MSQTVHGYSALPAAIAGVTPLPKLADVDLARSMHADDHQLITPGGATLSKEEYLGGIASGDLDYSVFEPASDIAERTAALRWICIGVRNVWLRCLEQRKAAASRFSR